MKSYIICVFMAFSVTFTQTQWVSGLGGLGGLGGLSGLSGGPLKPEYHFNTDAPTAYTDRDYRYDTDRVYRPDYDRDYRYPDYVTPSYEDFTDDYDPVDYHGKMVTLLMHISSKAGD